MECIGGGGIKREREEDEDEDDEDFRLPPEVWGNVARFLDAKDLKNLNLTEKYLQASIRREFFAKTRIHVTDALLNDKDFLHIAEFVKRVEVKTARHLERILIIAKYVNHVYYRPDHDDEPITRAFPNNVEHLVFGDRFNQPIFGLLPSKLKTLRFGAYFNQPVTNSIPKSVVDLWFGLAFDQSLYGELPPGLQVLRFLTNRIRRPLFDVLPETLVALQIGRDYPIDTNALPASLNSVNRMEGHDTYIFYAI
jgi:hypothetical protein